MMKWIVGLLLIANLALFGWMRWGIALTVDADAASVQTALNPDKVKLLEFLPASAAAPTSSLLPGVPLPLSPTPAPAAVASPAAVSEPAPRMPVTPLPHSSPVAASAPVSAKPERTEQTGCAEWGEFAGSDLVRAQEALATLKLGDDLSQRTVEQDRGYWVYIPPLKRRADVEKKIAQLKERGVNDYFLIQEKGKWMNAISLGVFKSEEAAKKFLAELRNRNVRSAKVGERRSKLKYTIFVMKELDSGTTDKLNVLQKQFPDSEIKVSACGN